MKFLPPADARKGRAFASIVKSFVDRISSPDSRLNYINPVLRQHEVARHNQGVVARGGFMVCVQRDLIDAVLSQPADDAPRLVYADWLDEHGVPIRANFIRVQCALASLEGRPAPSASLPSYRELERKCWQAKDEEEEWILPDGADELFPAGRHEAIPQDFHPKARARNVLPVIVWRRGFIHSISASLSRLRAILPVLVREHPIAEAIPTDRYPGSETVHGRMRYHWNSRSEHRGLFADPSQLPKDWDAPELERDFERPDEAVTALSNSLLRNAKARSAVFH
jgi:uncharacterized protein (TIGR02996 family)